MSAKEILAELPRLSAEERAELAVALFNFNAREALAAAVSRPLPQANMHAGAWEVADDFDDPLPDEFWLGEDA